MGFIDAMIAYLNGRAKTQLYGLFTFWLLLFHSNVIFTYLFVSQELIYKKTQLLKSEYISQTYFQFDQVNFWLAELAKILAAALLTYLMIWIFPKTIVAKAYDRELNDDYGRRSKKVQKEIDLEKQKQSLSTIKIDTVKLEEKAIEKQEDVENKEVTNWEKDYSAVPPIQLAKILNSLESAVYEHNGRFSKYFDDDAGEWLSPNVTADMLAAAHSIGLVEINNDRLILTPKGKYFLSKRYLRQNISKK